jgi:hypothetical protein
VIFNMATPDFGTKLDYWLNSVRSRASDPRQAPVILVGTHADDKICDDAFLKRLGTQLNRDFISRFFNIHGFVAVSSRASFSSLFPEILLIDFQAPVAASMNSIRKWQRSRTRRIWLASRSPPLTCFS